MHDELTREDIKKMQAELDRLRAEMPAILEEVKRTRAFGDLSENFEYKAAKQAKNKNESRIRYLKRMIATAVVIKPESKTDEAGLFDTVTLFMEDEQEEETITFVTTLRQNPMKGLISKESPVGKAVIGHKVGERVFVPVGEGGGYWAQIRKIEKGEDDDSMEISSY